VVIDGELSTTIQTETGELRLRDLHRGDVFGEVALFHGRRTADVTTESPRVLRRLF